MPDDWIEDGGDVCTHDCATGPDDCFGWDGDEDAGCCHDCETEPDECRPTGGRGPQPGDKPGWGAEYTEPEVTDEQH